jgi:hypothetical protein
LSSECPAGCEDDFCMQTATGFGLRCAQCRSGLVLDRITGVCGEIAVLPHWLVGNGWVNGRGVGERVQFTSYIRCTLLGAGACTLDLCRFVRCGGTVQR